MVGTFEVSGRHGPWQTGIGPVLFEAGQPALARALRCERIPLELGGPADLKHLTPSIEGAEAP